MKNPGRIFLLSAILLTLLFTINAFAEGIVLLPKTDLPYGKVWYLRGNPVSQQDFITYEIYLKKDRCHFVSKADGVVHKGETLTLTLDESPTDRPEKLIFQIAHAGNPAPFASMSCTVVNNPEPESIDDVKAFLQIQFGASAEIQ